MKKRLQRQLGLAMSMAIALCLISGIALASTGPLSSSPWPVFHRDLAHTGLSSFAGTPNTAISWSFETSGATGWGASPAMAGDGTIYIGADDGSFSAINPDGTKKWVTLIDATIGSSPAIGADGTVFVGAYDKNLYALDPADGSQEWAAALGGPVTSSSPAIDADGTLYVGAWDGVLYAIDSADGSQKWTFATGGPIDTSPAIGADGTIYVGSSDHKLYAVNPSDGSEKWSFGTGGGVYTSPAITPDGTLFFGSNDHKVYALNPSDGSKKWEFTTNGDVSSSPAIGTDGTVYVGSGTGDALYALNSADGSKKWEFAAGGDVYSSPAIGPDGAVYFESDDCLLYAINPDGTLRWTFVTGDPLLGDRGSSSPAVRGDGMVYVGGGYSLFAIRSFSLTYSAGTGGSIIGRQHQVIVSGTDGTVVTAAPAPGYRFSSWSDGVMTAVRQDMHSTSDVNVAAIFSAVATQLTMPKVSPSTPRRRKIAAFSSTVNPADVSFAGGTTVLLWHYETKVVRKKVRGSWKRVRVKYWRLRKKMPAVPQGAGVLAATYKPRYSGKWRVAMQFFGSTDFVPGLSPTKTFRVK